MNKSAIIDNPWVKLMSEAIGLLFLAAVMAVGWNYFSSSRIAYLYDYYPEVTAEIVTGPVIEKESTSSASLINWQGRGELSQEDLMEIVSNKDYKAQRWVLIDARKDKLFNEGHIRGAKKFNRYRLAHDLPKVLPKCRSAKLVIVYCQGGKCEDSHIAKKILTQAGVSSKNIVILDGGYLKWISNGNEVVK